MADFLDQRWLYDAIWAICNIHLEIIWQISGTWLCQKTCAHAQRDTPWNDEWFTITERFFLVNPSPNRFVQSNMTVGIYSIDTYIVWLVVWNMIFMTFHMLGRMLPTDFHIFQRGWNHQAVVYWYAFFASHCHLHAYIYIDIQHVHEKYKKNMVIAKNHRRFL